MVAVIICMAVAVAALIRFGGKDHEPVLTDEKDVEESFTPRRSANELEQGLAQLRAELGGLPAEVAIKGAEGEAREYLEQHAELQRQQTPSQALQHAREKLAEIEAQLAETTTEKERERLERQKKLVEKTLARLEAMQGR